MLPLSTPGRNVPAVLPMICKAAAVGCVTTVLISTAMPCGSTLKVLKPLVGFSMANPPWLSVSMLLVLLMVSAGCPGTALAMCMLPLVSQRLPKVLVLLPKLYTLLLVSMLPLTVTVPVSWLVMKLIRLCSKHWLR